MSECNQLVETLKAEVKLHEKIKEPSTPEEKGNYILLQQSTYILNNCSTCRLNTKQYRRFKYLALISVYIGMDLNELLEEIRSLRIQLERSIETNNALRSQLEEQLLQPNKKDNEVTTINIHHHIKNKKSHKSPSPSTGAKRRLQLSPCK